MRYELSASDEVLGRHGQRPQQRREQARTAEQEHGTARRTVLAAVEPRLAALG